VEIAARDEVMFSSTESDVEPMGILEEGSAMRMIGVFVTDKTQDRKMILFCRPSKASTVEISRVLTWIRSTFIADNY
jgi:hypothetical protein